MKEGRKSQTCVHGVLGIEKCRECVRARRRRSERKRLSNPETRARVWANNRRWKDRNGDHVRAYARRRRGIPVADGKQIFGECPLCLVEKILVPDHNHQRSLQSNDGCVRNSTIRWETYSDANLSGGGAICRFLN